MFRSARLTIRAKIALGYALILFCLGASIIVVTDRISALQDEVESITTRDVEVHNLIATIQADALNMETAQRGFVITGSERYLEPYELGRTDWEASYNRLYDYLSNNPKAQRQLEEVKTSIQGWLTDAGEPVITLKREGRTDEINEFFSKDIGKTYMDRLRTQLTTISNQELETTSLHIVDLRNKNRLLTIGIYVLLGVAGLLSFLIISFVSSSIVKTIHKVVRTINEMASSGGDLKTRIQVHTNDEIKDLAEATNELLGKLESQNWIQSKVAEVSTMNQGINDLSQLAASFLTRVAPMINASYGVFYLLRGTGDNQLLAKIAAYADDGETVGADSFKLGEGLVGQCGVERRVFLLNSPKEHAAVITTGLIRIQPQSVLIVPIEYEGKLQAVIEFASTDSFTSQHLTLIEELESDFGIAVNNVAGRMEVERLLSESQVLTEELQMQQEEMRMTTEHLEEQNLFAEQKTRELEKAREELEHYSQQLQRSSQYKTNFLANMSHELRTPLNSILILSQMLAENDNRTLTDEEEGYAKVIHSSGADLLKLIDDILDLSKIEAGKIVLTMDEVNLTEIPELLRMSFQPIADKKGLGFTIESSPKLPDLWPTDGQRLQQILKNLLSNAFKFTEQGSVHLTMEIINDQPESEEILAISITDTGIGVPPEKRQLIFEAFQQADSETNRQYGGTGLGLSICNEFVKLLKGRIELQSTPGQGSCFTVYLPRMKQADLESLMLSQDEIAVTLETPPLERMDEDEELTPATEMTTDVDLSDDLFFKDKHVLLVEDDARNVYAIVKALESKHIHVTVAGNGKRCMELLQEKSDYDLILMDIMMPLMDGYETMRAIREETHLTELPIIALTAKAMKSDRDKCLEAGASDYISKPIQMEQLFSLMRVWLTKQVGNS